MTLNLTLPDSGSEALFTLTVYYHGQPIPVPIHEEDATLQDLSDLIAEERIPPSNQKIMITPKIGLLRPPFKDKPPILLRSLVDKKIVLMGATSTEVAELESDIADRKARMIRRQEALRAGRRVHAQRRNDPQAQAHSMHIFHKIEALPYLPNPDKSLRFLQRLADDAGIKASMRKHGFSVGLLTELNPAEHTTHESKTLGLNKNRGEVIYLRLRTDAYDGYRDYKVIRKTLCHELAHNVWGEHDQNFWKLCKEIEQEVGKNDWRRGGHSVGGEEFYNPGDEGINDEDFVDEEHSWQGGVHVLGGASTSSPMHPREAMARAAEARAAEERSRKSQQPPNPDSQ